ncbi:uncharacterized protein LOC108302189 [Cebus imitator]|uniref:uncharacterized protein LOC108302189 n=1 Tax=Cebus imitator TaxID=2715852 RepID=UPI000809B8B4|nr:uncharacterized protein LOC108302189 [Cebus imitator]
MSPDPEARRARSRQTCYPPPPRAAAAARGLVPGPRCGCVRLGAGAGASAGLATLAGCAPHWGPVQFASFPRGTARIWTAGAAAATTRSTEVGVPGPAAERREREAHGTPTASSAPALPSRGCGLCFRTAVGAAEVATVQPHRVEKPPNPRGHILASFAISPGPPPSFPSPTTPFSGEKSWALFLLMGKKRMRPLPSMRPFQDLTFPMKIPQMKKKANKQVNSNSRSLLCNPEAELND